MTWDDIELTEGGHESRDKGMCLMEATAFMTGSEHSAMPACTAEWLSTWGQRLNDRAPTYAARQSLKCIGPLLVNTTMFDLEVAKSIYTALDGPTTSTNLHWWYQWRDAVEATLRAMHAGITAEDIRKANAQCNSTVITPQEMPSSKSSLREYYEKLSSSGSSGTGSTDPSISPSAEKLDVLCEVVTK